MIYYEILKDKAGEILKSKEIDKVCLISLYI